MGRQKGDETEHLIGRKQPPDLGPLFGDEPEPAEKRAPGPAGKRYKELPASYDTVIGRHAAPATTVLGPRGRVPEDISLRGKTAPGSETSERAARQIDEHVPTLAWLVLQHIISCGAHGATREEVTIALGKRLSSVTARVHELYVMGHIGSNCTERCTEKCDHPRESRINPETSMANEVMLYETHVLRWRLDQSRPPTPLKHGRRNG